ncbi:excinuclease ABC subunit UvrA [Candidatus Deianiraea vastatrix]|uniref:UvrABC system protein A n=1 Tax=Candidatus Deianiraea vastatrix TaxID=2163644 RepID=A0A5B8XET4_9RICK|nr:excinuclease ABC subunit UvrA [Candidatus Deianiraea vastatrix]QED23476.1 UvrABC system protein A [Candidatus Deianiraea vastatrix]
MEPKFISIKGARENNLKNVDVDIPKNSLVVITGPSGSGKSSLAFETIYAEGQRRYVESLSSYARQFLNLQEKPDVDSITGLSPAIAIDQKTTSKNPRSTVGTVTEIYDYLRVLFARVGIVYSPATGEPIQSQSASDMVKKLRQFPDGTKFYICAPVIRGQKGEHVKEFLEYKKAGYSRFKINGELYEGDSLPKLDKNKKNEIEIVVDRIALSDDIGNRLADSIETSLRLADGILHVEVVSFPQECNGKFKIGENFIEEKQILVMSEKFSCPVSDFTLEEIEPRIFSFNSPFGACRACDGLGTEKYFNIDLVVPNQNLSLADGAILPWTRSNPRYYRQIMESLAAHFKFSITTPFKDLSNEVKHMIMHGSNDEIQFTFSDDFRKYTVARKFAGVMEDLSKRHDESDDDSGVDYEKYQNLIACRVCNGYRLREASLSVKIYDKHIGEVSRMTVLEAHEWFSDLSKHLTKTQNEIATRVIKEIKERLTFLLDVGLDYLNLDRSSSTLSGGESQRIRLASQIGSGLSGVMYVLDEPSIGLHQSDNTKLIKTLKNLRDMGNTVLVVEHDEDTMHEADHIIDVGPCAGSAGGYIVAEGDVEHIKSHKDSITGKFLSGREKIDVPLARRKYGNSQKITVVNAHEHNLKNITVDIPLGMFVCVTGVSGGGKSTLIIDTLYQAINNKINGSSKTPGLHDKITGIENIDKIIEIDQSPIGRTPRSNPATYIGAFNHIRDYFTALPEAKARGYKPGRFSFNVKGGRCEKCQGDGVLTVEMHFLPDVYIVCDACKGKRYNRETLEVKYNGKSISDVLEMTAEEAHEFFKNIPSIKDKFKAMKDVGLGYIKIGQQATTLSGGEAQRIKLSKELCKKATGNTLYILDEPTTGLHSCDIKKLLEVLHTLVDYGNSMLVIEHNMDVIKTSDYVIDIGPKGGMAGGIVVAKGTPEEVVTVKNSITGQYLAKYLPKHEEKAKKSDKAKKIADKI